jgi:hypothetical protein
MDTPLDLLEVRLARTPPHVLVQEGFVQTEVSASFLRGQYLDSLLRVALARIKISDAPHLVPVRDLVVVRQLLNLFQCKKKSNNEETASMGL